MRPLVILCVGLVFTGLVIGVPLSLGLASGALKGPGMWLLYGLPLVALLVCMWTRHPWVGVWVFPVSHLPALLMDTQLTGARMYEGPAGVVRLTVVALVGWMWFVAFLRRSPSPPARLEADAVGDEASSVGPSKDSSMPGFGRVLPVVAPAAAAPSPLCCPGRPGRIWCWSGTRSRGTST